MSLFFNAHKLPSIDLVIEHSKYFSVPLKIARTLESVSLAFSCKGLSFSRAGALEHGLYTHTLHTAFFCHLLSKVEHSPAPLCCVSRAVPVRWQRGNAFGKSCWTWDRGGPSPAGCLVTWLGCFTSVPYGKNSACSFCIFSRACHSPKELLM